MTRKFVLSCELAEQEFSTLPIRIGRNALNDFKVPYHLVSSFHAKVEEVDGIVGIVDLDSKNGTYVRSPSGLTRLPPGELVDVSHCNNEFLLGPSFVVRLDVSSAPGRAPSRAFSGSVLGNRNMLSVDERAYGVRGSNPPESLPALDPIRPLPALDASRAHPARRSPSAPPPAPKGLPVDLARVAFPSNVPPSHAAALRGTGDLKFSLADLALTGLRELATSLMPGRNVETTGDVARLVTRLHDAVEVFCRCFIPLREGHAQFVSSLDLQQEALRRGRFRSAGYARVEAARTPEEVAAALLDFRDQSEDSAAAVENIFTDLMVHQVALLDGMMQGVRALLDELSPERIEEAVDASTSPLTRSLGRHKALWNEFEARYEEVSSERQALRRIFGSEFAGAYRQYGKKRDE